MNPGPGVKKWDKVMLSLFVLGLLSILVVAGIDHRYAWTGPLGATAPALLLNFIGGSFVMWASTINPFFSNLVRIQSDRGHEVISTGPYAVGLGAFRHLGGLCRAQDVLGRQGFERRAGRLFRVSKESSISPYPRNLVIGAAPT